MVSFSLSGLQSVPSLQYDVAAVYIFKFLEKQCCYKETYHPLLFVLTYAADM